jgi:hypothetical protein
MSQELEKYVTSLQTTPFLNTFLSFSSSTKQGLVFYPRKLNDQNLKEIPVQVFAEYSFKLKGASHQMTKNEGEHASSIAGTSTSSSLDTPTDPIKFAELYLTEARLEQGFFEISSNFPSIETHSEKFMKKFVEWEVSDIKKESGFGIFTEISQLDWTTISKRIEELSWKYAENLKQNTSKVAEKKLFAGFNFHFDDSFSLKEKNLFKKIITDNAGTQRTSKTRR